MQHGQNPHQSQIPPTQPLTGRRPSAGTVVGIVLGSLFASCFVCGGVAMLLEEQPPASAQGEERAASELRAADEPQPGIGPLTPAECVAGYENAQTILPKMKIEPAPAEICLQQNIDKWGPDAGIELRCVASATSPGELQLCGGSWMGTVADYVAKFGDVASIEEASDLGITPEARKHLASVAKAYGVPAQTVGDKAAKASELCLGGMDAVRAKPAVAVRKVEGALEFAMGIAKNDRAQKATPLDDVFVTYVTMNCPDPATR